MSYICLIFVIVFHTTMCKATDGISSTPIIQNSNDILRQMTSSSVTPKIAQRTSTLGLYQGSPLTMILKKRYTKEKLNAPCPKLPFNCPPISDPHCIKIKYKDKNLKKTVYYIEMINKCEMDYAECYQGPNATVTEVPLKYCNSKNKPAKRASRFKRENIIIGKDLLALLSEIDRKKGLLPDGKQQLREGKDNEKPANSKSAERSGISSESGSSSDSEDDRRVVRQTQARKKRSITNIKDLNNVENVVKKTVTKYNASSKQRVSPLRSGESPLYGPSHHEGDMEQDKLNWYPEGDRPRVSTPWPTAKPRRPRKPKSTTRRSRRPYYRTTRRRRYTKRTTTTKKPRYKTKKPTTTTTKERDASSNEPDPFQDYSEYDFDQPRPTTTSRRRKTTESDLPDYESIDLPTTKRKKKTKSTTTSKKPRYYRTKKPKYYTTKKPKYYRTKKSKYYRTKKDKIYRKTTRTLRRTTKERDDEPTPFEDYSGDDYEKLNKDDDGGGIKERCVGFGCTPDHWYFTEQPGSDLDSDEENENEIIENGTYDPVHLKEYNADCPKECPSRDVMVCARCKDGVFKTFPSTCHMRMFNCKYPNEKLQLVSRRPCVMLAPYRRTLTELNGRVQEFHDDDQVMRYIWCKHWSSKGGSILSKHDPRCRGNRIKIHNDELDEKAE